VALEPDRKERDTIGRRRAERELAETHLLHRRTSR
jgi:hypothetical protein